MDTQNLVSIIGDFVPGAPKQDLEVFALILAKMSRADVSVSDIETLIRQNRELLNLLHAMAGKNFQASDTVVQFGDGAQTGDIIFRDVAGGNIVHFHLHLESEARKKQSREVTISEDERSRKEELLIKHKKSLHKLQLQAAQFGLYCPPYISLEIENTEKIIKDLELKLKNL